MRRASGLKSTSPMRALEVALHLKATRGARWMGMKKAKTKGIKHVTPDIRRCNDSGGGARLFT